MNGRTMGPANAANAFSTELSRAGPISELTRSQGEPEVVRRPARLGLSRHCGLTPSIAASASPF
jgi:hypothetical protein